MYGAGRIEGISISEDRHTTTVTSLGLLLHIWC